MPIGFNLEKYKNRVFIETGTWKGEGCINAIESGFEVIHSIEILPETVEIAKENLKPYTSKADITLYLGDSATALKEILNKVDEPATFWLDGHGGYPGAGSGIKNCPLYEELDQIKNHHIKNHTIMIDDLRIIKGHAWGTTEVTYEGILERVKNINPDYEISFEDGNLNGHIFPNDCLIAKIP